MTHFLKLTTLITLALFSNLAVYSTAKTNLNVRKIALPSKISGLTLASKPANKKSGQIKGGYKAEFLDTWGKDFKKCDASKRQLIRALLESDITAIRKHITSQNVNDVFEARSLDAFNCGRVKVPFKQSLIKIPYLSIAIDVYYEAPNKQAKQHALLIIKELLKLGANPNKARVALWVIEESGEQISTNVAVPPIYLIAAAEEPVLFELFLQHKGSLNAQMCTITKDKAAGKGVRKQCFTLADGVKYFKNPKMKALAYKYANKK